MSDTEKFRELLTAKVQRIDRQMSADTDSAAAFLKGRAAHHEEKVDRVGHEFKKRLQSKIEQPRAAPQQATSLIKSLGLIGVSTFGVLAAMAVGAGWAFLHYDVGSPWVLAGFVVFLVLMGISAEKPRAPAGTVAHGKFATREDMDAHDIEIDTTKPDTKDQGIYLGTFDDPDGKWRTAELRYKGAKHLLCFGPTGSGKSNSLMIANLQNLRRSIIVTDPKGEAAGISYEHRHKMGNAIVLNPFGVLVDDLPHLKSVGWNPLLQLDPESDDFDSEASCIAEALTDKSGDSKSEFFETSMENLWTAFCMWERSTKGDQASLRNVRESIALPRDKLLIVLEAMKSSKNYGMRIAANRAYDRLTDKNSQSTSLQDVIDTGLKSTNFLNDRRIADDMAKGGAIDFAALHRTITTIYLILPPLELDHQAKWLRMFVSLALRNLYKSAPTKKNPPTLPRVLFMLDEFGSLGRLQEIVKAQNLVRSYRIQLWLFMQYMEQITETYKGAASSFLSNAGAVTTFKTGALDITTAKHLAEAFGEKEMMVHTHNNSGGNDGPQAIPLIRASDISRLRPDTTINIIEPCPWPVLATTPVYTRTRFKEGLEDNPTYFG